MQRSTSKYQNNLGAYICMNGQKLEEVTSFKYLGATLCEDDTCSAEVRIRICLSNGSNGQTKQDLAMQHYQLRMQGQAVQASCYRQPVLWL